MMENSENKEKHFKVPNKHLTKLHEDVLYHIGFSSKDDLPKLFGDVKFVCMGGSAKRMFVFAKFMQEQLIGIVDCKDEPKDICSTDRYSMYKVGPVLAVNHGIGMPSLSILLHEVMKLLHYAKCSDVVMVRIGTSGGIGVKPGTVVVTETAVNEMFEPKYHLAVLGKIKSRNTPLCKDMLETLLSCKQETDSFDVVKGKTLSTSDFYENQGRLDGALCDYTEEDKMEYLREAEKHGVKNIEMESTCFAAMCDTVGIPAAIVCVALLNRLEGDQVSTPPSELKQMEMHPQQIVSRYIKQKLSK
ncbi:uridine phosphorylase 1-like [Antedon mediterranea]|uniref:uridine phosphorylase 1-like n=1 Tax=Antedon mediterranea TaxID=105859 RepID=UPI003AF4DE12